MSRNLYNLVDHELIPSKIQFSIGLKAVPVRKESILC